MNCDSTRYGVLSRRARAAAAGLLATLTFSMSLAARTSDEENTEKAAPTVDAKDANQRIEKLVGASDPLEVRRATHDLVELGPGALDPVREKLDSSEGTARQRLRVAATRLVAARLSEEIAEKLETGLVFDGQYDHLRDRPFVKDALDLLVDDEATPLRIRLGALNALADVADEDYRKRVEELLADPLLAPLLRQELGVLLAILGDTRKVEHEISQLERYSEVPRPEQALAANLQLANLYYKIRKYDKAIECYDRIIRVIELVRNRVPEARLTGTRFDDRSLALQHYNAACSQSLDGNVEEARDHLKKAILLDPSHFKNMEIDGDLTNVREAEGHEDFRKKLSVLLQADSI